MDHVARRVTLVVLVVLWLVYAFGVVMLVSLTWQDVLTPGEKAGTEECMCTCHDVTEEKGKAGEV